MPEGRVPESGAEHDPDGLDRELEAVWRGQAGGLFDRLMSEVNLEPSAMLSQARGNHADEDFSTDAQQFPVIDGYTLLRLIARGGMGEVYEAAQILTRRRVALKVMRPAPGGDDAHRQELFDREVRVLARLSHPAIAMIHAAGQTRARRRYLAMELIDGVNLLDFANARGKATGALPLRCDERLRLFCMICDAIDYAHKRDVVHRDLKPANILVVSGGKPKVVDFGLASLLSVHTDLSNSAGTLRYMSPEQIRGGSDRIDGRSDIYTLGVILYELMCNQPPYRVTPYLPDEARRLICEVIPPPPSAHNHALPHRLDAIVLRALEKQPGKRYRAAADLSGEIERHVLRGKPDPTRWQVFLNGLFRRRRA